MTLTTIGVTGLRAKYSGEDQLVFRDLSLHIPQGQKLLLLGPSGCGKSTLLQILSGIIPASVRMPMVAEHITKPASWGFVFQDPDTQFCMSYVDEELAFVLENQSVPQEKMQSKIIAALNSVRLQLPQLHTPIAELSQGMKQRLALAATLLLQPEVVFLDEPSALLDPHGKQMVWQSIRAALQQQTVIVVEHHIDGILNWFDRVVVLDNKGSIVADDTPLNMFQQHKALLMQYGIWYPHIWEEAWQTKPARSFGEMQQVAKRKEASSAEAAASELELAADAESEITMTSKSVLTATVQPELTAVAKPALTATVQPGSTAVAEPVLVTETKATLIKALPTASTYAADVHAHPSYDAKPHLLVNESSNASPAPPLLELEQFTATRGACTVKVNYAAARQGEWIAITGMNGAGKSTLLLALARLLPSSGSYRINGQIAPPEIPEQVSYVFQNPELQFITDTITDEVLHSLLLAWKQTAAAKPQPIQTKHSWLKLFQPRSKRKNKMAYASKLTNRDKEQHKQSLTAQAIAALDQLKLNVSYDRHPYELSVGQKRRLSVLTALVEGRSILLLDEPTFGQDASSTFVMLEWLLQLQAAGNTIIMVTHDEQIAARFATQIWQMQHGCLQVKLPQPNKSDKEVANEQSVELVHTC